MSTTRIWTLVMILAAFAGTPAQASVPKTVQLRGYALVNQNLRDRLIAPGKKFDLSAYLGAGTSTGLLDLLGTYAGSDGTSDFRNGEPNPVNALIWYLLLDSFSKDAGATCTGNSSIPWNADIGALILRLCAWPAASAKDEQSLTTLWWTLTDFDSPPAEFEAWKALALSQALAALPGPRAVAALILSAVYNPFFLFQE